MKICVIISLVGLMLFHLNEAEDDIISNKRDVLQIENTNKFVEHEATVKTRKSDEDEATVKARKFHKDKATVKARKFDEDETTVKAKNFDEDEATVKAKKFDEDEATVKAKKIDEDEATVKAKKIDEDEATERTNKFAEVEEKKGTNKFAENKKTATTNKFSSFEVTVRRNNSVVIKILKRGNKVAEDEEAMEPWTDELFDGENEDAEERVKDGKLIPYIGLVKTDSVSCTVSLIHPYWALTSSSCIYYINGDDATVYFGVGNINDENVMKAKVGKLFFNPDYIPGKLINDIGIIRFQKPLRITKNVIFITLGINDWNEESKNCKTVGFNEDGLTFKVKSSAGKGDKYCDCVSKDRFLCVNETESVNECIKVLGAPLICGNSLYGVRLSPYDNLICQNGIDSYTRTRQSLQQCLGQETPMLYTYIDNYVPWIYNILGEYSERAVRRLAVSLPKEKPSKAKNAARYGYHGDYGVKSDMGDYGAKKRSNKRVVNRFQNQEQSYGRLPSGQAALNFLPTILLIPVLTLI